MPVIWTGLHNPVWDIPAAGIGYMVRKSAQGRGFATESTNALLRFAFNALGMKRVAIAHAEGNEASAAVIRKLGFHFEAFEKYGTYLPDRRAVNKFSYARFDADGLPDLAVKWGPP